MTYQRLQLQWIDLGDAFGSRIAHMRLNRPDTANAFDAGMIAEITRAISEVCDSEARCLVVDAAGKHFSAGADLAWMKHSMQLSYQENIQEARDLGAMFEALRTLAIPTIAVCQGASFGGGVGLLACCDIVLADVTSKFCLSEVKLGILPAVIMPYLLQKMQLGPCRRMMLTAKIFDAEAAQTMGLVDVLFEGKDRQQVLKDEINFLLKGAPQAQAAVKSLLKSIIGSADTADIAQQSYQAIAKARQGSEGQAGFAAFFDKEPSPWAHELDEIPSALKWTLDLPVKHSETTNTKRQ